MNEELDSQLSAMFDDELPEAECQLLARRLSRDDALKARWRRYAVIGAAVRAERGVRLEADLSGRVSAAISSEPALAGAAVARSHLPHSSAFHWWHPVVGGAIAAGVAALSIMWVRAQAPGDELLMARTSEPQAIVARVGAPAAISNDSSTPESYVVPPNVEPRSIMPAAELANYVVAHSEYSTPVSRRNLLSALVASESGYYPGAAADSEGAGNGVGQEDANTVERLTGDVEESN